MLTTIVVKVGSVLDIAIFNCHFYFRYYVTVDHVSIT